MEGAGNLKVDKFTNRIGLSFTQNEQTVVMSGDIVADGKSLSITGFNTQTIENGMTIAGQKTVGPVQFLKLKTEVESILKAGGYKSGTIQFQRSRVEGSPLPDSKDRIVNLNLSNQ